MKKKKINIHFSYHSKKQLFSRINYNYRFGKLSCIDKELHILNDDKWNSKLEPNLMNCSVSTSNLEGTYHIIMPYLQVV